MDHLAEDVLEAQQDQNKLNQLLHAYLPFIKKQLAGLQNLSVDYDDMLSLSMLTFAGCIMQYSCDKGNFLAFCSVCIRNRLLDENRKHLRHARQTISLDKDSNGENYSAADTNASLARYQVEQERYTLSEEINAYANSLILYGICFTELTEIAPRQMRSRKLCQDLAKEILQTPAYYHELTVNRRISQKELAGQFHISPKTIEKHRKYIVALVVVMAGDYPLIRSFIPDFREVI